MSDTFLGMLAFLAIVVLTVGSIVWMSRRSHALLERWAGENGCLLISAEHRVFRRGPFLLTTARGQTVYFITVMDAAGRERSGYVRCGSFWGGLLSDKVEVRWDEPAGF